MNDSSGDTMGSTIASRGPISQENPVPTDSRINTVLPKVEWQGEVPHLVSNNRDRFEELGVLGVGGMGEVVLAKDHDIGRNVALKRMSPGTDMGKVLRFVDEVRAVGSLEHPNIVPVHDVGIDAGGRFFFVMKRLEGETLEAVISRLRAGDPAAHEKYSFPMRAQLFLGICSAVAYAHKQGFVHRDLKPANIMLGPFGEVTVMDWGLAKRIRGPQTRPLPGAVTEPHSGPRRPTILSTQLGTLMGTPLYMSPEQARGEHDKVDERSDIYSLMVLFHELCTHRHYLTGRTTLAEVIEGVKAIGPERIGLANRNHVDSVPTELQWFFLRGFAKSPEERFQSVDDLIETLQKLLDGRFAVQCPRTMAKRVLVTLAKALERKPAVVFPLMLASVVLGVVAIGKLLFDVISALSA